MSPGLPPVLDRGRRLLPHEVIDRVVRRLGEVAPADYREFAARNHIVVHPWVVDGIWSNMPPTYTVVDEASHERWRRRVCEDYSSGAPRLRVCGLLVDGDPGIRLDEVVLRREERL